MSTPETPAPRSDFIREIITADRQAGKHQGRVVTRFPPEPNGYPHIGHAKSICLNFGLARDFDGVCNLRMDDTNPTTEDQEYVESFIRDVRWLGFEWGKNFFYASDYYERLYEYAVALIKAGKAYVCSLSEDEIRKYRGTAFEPGRPSPYRDRSVEENLDLFERMRKGEFPDGAHVLRGKIDMASPNLKMRDWAFYRIRHAHHYRTGSTWHVYPLYDFAHCLSDAIEGITHSICTLEFENNRELYDWILDAAGFTDPGARPRQLEFARLNMTYLVMSKRKLLQLVEQKLVSGWDDPRMPTIAGMRRRGYTPEAVRDLCERVGVAKNNSTVEIELLEHVVREDLNHRSPRVMTVLKPLEVVIESYPAGEVEEIDAPYWPADVGKQGSRKVPFSRTIFIEQGDFMEEPPKDFHRLAPGREVRLRHAYVIRCTGVEKNDAGEVVRVRAVHEPGSRGAEGGGKKIKGTLHWVSAKHAAEVEVRLYDRLIKSELVGPDDAFTKDLNPESLVTVKGLAEPSLRDAKPEDRFQFERLGFFYVDPVDSKPGAPVFNRTVQLKDAWARKTAAAEPAAAPKAKAPKAEGAKAEAPRVEALLSDPARALHDEHGLSPADARILGDDAELGALFAGAVAAHNNPKAIANWIVNELRGKAGKVTGAALGELVALIDAGTISGKIGKEVLVDLVAKGGSPKAIVAEKGLSQIADTGAIEAAVDAVLAENADAVARFKGGNLNLKGAFVGMVMKKTGGKANPKLVNELLDKKLS